MQALINTAWIVYDPMTNGMKLSPKNMELYAKAEAIAPENPRVVFLKQNFKLMEQNGQELIQNHCVLKLKRQ